jgi:hypothetical protein
VIKPLHIGSEAVCVGPHTVLHPGCGPVGTPIN